MTGEDEATSKFLHAIHGVFLPNRVLIRLAPSAPPRELARWNGTLRALVDGLPDAEPSVRVCENLTCGRPIYDPAELKL